MAYRRLPISNPQRYSALRMISNRKAVTPPAQMPFSADTIARIDNFFPIYHDKIIDVSKTLAQQAGISAEVAASKQLAILFIKDFIDALQNAIRRKTFEAPVRALYGLPVEKRKRLKISTEQDVINWGEKIHDGETRRIALGGVPVSFPSLSEVDAATEDFRTKNNQQSNKKDAYDNAQEALQAENAKADKLILKCWNEIEATYDEGDKPSLRRKAREWGVIYVPRKGENIDPAEFSIKGKITEQGKRKGIKDAVIKVIETGATVLSETNGSYLVPVLPIGNYTLEISKVGYRKQTISVTVSEGNITTLNEELEMQ